MKCSISTYYKILDAELYDFDDGYMQLNVDIDTKNIDLEEYVSMQKKEHCGYVQCAGRKGNSNISIRV